MAPKKSKKNNRPESKKSANEASGEKAVKHNGNGKTIQEAMFDFMLRGALNDAVSMKSYERGKRAIKEKIQGSKARTILKNYVDLLIQGKKPDFWKCERDLETAIGDKDFRFGNCQKLINMLAKNFFLAFYREDEKTRRSRFENCHCPMDRIMIQNVRTAYREKFRDRYPNVPWTSVSWSRIEWNESEKRNWDEGKVGFSDRVKKTTSLLTYLWFQRMVSELAEMEHVCPIEYDFWHWKS